MGPTGCRALYEGLKVNHSITFLGLYDNGGRALLLDDVERECAKNENPKKRAKKRKLLRVCPNLFRLSGTL